MLDMRIRLIFSVFLMSLVLFVAKAQELNFAIVELKGQVDVKSREGDWQNASLSSIISAGTELFTGYHSQVSLEIGKDSYVTINQFTHVTIEKILVRKEEATTNIKLNRGYLVVLARPIGEFQNRIFITTKDGNIQFNNSGGEVYLRRGKGIVVKSFKGKISLGTKFSKVYYIKKDEMCGILPGGRLLESDHFVRRNINGIPNSISSPTQIQAYYDLLFQHYSNDYWSNDFRDHYQP